MKAYFDLDNYFYGFGFEELIENSLDVSDDEYKNFMKILISDPSKKLKKENDKIVIFDINEDLDYKSRTRWKLLNNQWVIDDRPLRPEIPKADVIREERNMLLSWSDWTQLFDSPVQNKTEWAEYRQLLRDITDQPTFPESVIWPTKPEIIKA